MQRETEDKLETEAVKMIIERLVDCKPSLYWHYTREVSEKNLGSIASTQRRYSSSTSRHCPNQVAAMGKEEVYHGVHGYLGQGAS